MNPDLAPIVPQLHQTPPSQSELLAAYRRWQRSQQAAVIPTTAPSRQQKRLIERKAAKSLAKRDVRAFRSAVSAEKAEARGPRLTREVRLVGK